MNNKSIAVISPIGASSFAEVDANILSKEYVVTHVKVTGNTKLGLIKSYLFDVIPAVWKNDIAYVWFADGHALAAAVAGKLFRKNVVTVVGGYEVSGHAGCGYGNQLSKYRRFITNNALKLSTLVINQSQYYTDMTRKLVDYKVMLITIHPPVDTSRGEVVPKERCVAMVASANEDNILLKGIDVFDLLAHAFQNEKVPCYLIGSYDESQVRKYPHITYVGKLPHDELLKFLGKVKVYCQLSRAESFGVSVVEAMSRGCIPVVTDTEALPEVVSNYGKVVKLFSSNWFCKEIWEPVNKSLDEEPSEYMFQYVQQFSIEDRSYKLLFAIRALETQ